VAPDVVVAPAVVVVALAVVVVALAVVVVAPLVVVAPEVLVAPLVVVALAVVVVALAVVVVVPPVVVADASCPTLTPASTSRATVISQAAGRLDAFLTCLAIDPYLLLSSSPHDLLVARHVQDKQDRRLLALSRARAKGHNARLAAAADRADRGCSGSGCSDLSLKRGDRARDAAAG